mgnify:CR=1 FL=1
MSDAVHHGKNEIIIVRRRGTGEDGHHTGAWKIAYADFMTAMMAFFLVMWLINAANEETKAAVASYFNPIKLTDERPTDKGIKQVGNTQDGEQSAPRSTVKGDDGQTGDSAESGDQQNSTAGEKTDYSEADYFKDPYAVLAEIAQETGKQMNVSDAGEGGAQTSGPATGASGGDAYRDPFDPDFWSKAIDEDRKAIEDSQALIKHDRQAAPKGDAAERTADTDGSGRQVADTGKPAEVAGAEGAMTADGRPAESQAEALRRELAAALSDGAAGKLAEGLTVMPAEGGLLVSITDNLNFGMFRIGSAVPERDLVVAMERIGKALAGRPGRISIRGYTDARPFTNGTDDNWRLSTARAHSAYFMLVRGGIPEERIVQLSGFADRRPKDPTDPYAEVNRRIEILLEADGG